MIGLTYEQILTKIQQEKGVTRDQLEAKVKAKLAQLSNLISKEGAAHIVATELGVKLMDLQKAKRFKIKDLVPMLRNVEFVGKVLQIYEVRTYQKENRSGRVGSLMLGDETGLIRMTLWDEKLIDKVPQVKEGDILKVTGGYIKENNGFKELHLGSYSTMNINPEGEKVDSVAQPQKREAVKKQISELQENDFAEINGIVVQAFEPRFYEGCPDCGKKMLEMEGKLMCKDHGQREPRPMPVLNLVMDDGTDTIRTVCFRDQAEKLLSADLEKIKELKLNQALAQATANNLIGKQLKISGKVNKNIMFERLEFSATDVQETDPKEMLNELAHDV